MNKDLHNLIDNTVSACQDLQTPCVLEIDSWNQVVMPVKQALEDMGYFVAQIDKAPIRNKDELLYALDKACNFPDYFGFNWDALEDSLTDFYWQPAKGYALMLGSFGHLQSNDSKTFMEIVQNVCITWAHRGIPFKLLIPQID